MLIQEIFHPTHAAVLQAHDLTGGPTAVPLFERVRFNLPPGVTAVTGDEGQGKTSLLRLLATDFPATSGQMRLAGITWPEQPATWKQEVFWADLRLPEHDEDTPEQCWSALRGRYPRFSDALLQELVAILKLGDHTQKGLYMLSTGSRRKVGLAGALACGATVTLLDQPFAALDLASIREVLVFLQDMSGHTTRAWVVADYEAPDGVELASVIRL
jgi:ABC-type multidrug transport system ATPase subunit